MTFNILTNNPHVRSSFLKLITTFLLLVIWTSTPLLYAQIVQGYATYYGKQFHGKMTTSGERINMNDFVAAHKNLPFGTRVKVTNRKNNKSVIVRITDRCSRKKPWKYIDLSYGAAKAIGMLDDGKVVVTLEVLDNAALAKNQTLLNSQLRMKSHGEMVDSLEHNTRNSLLKSTRDTSHKFGVVIGTSTNQNASIQNARAFSRKHKRKTIVISKNYKKRVYHQITVVGFQTYQEANLFRMEILTKTRGAKVIRYT